MHSKELIERLYQLYDTTNKGYGLIAQELGMSRYTVGWYIRKRRKANEKTATTNEQ